MEAAAVTTRDFLTAQRRSTFNFAVNINVGVSSLSRFNRFTVVLQVIDLLKERPSAGLKQRLKQSFLGKCVCQSAFRRLVGLGPTRFEKLRCAASNGEAAPIDRRTLPRKLLCNNKVSIERRSAVTEFLSELYNTLSEPMPEANSTLKRKADFAFGKGDGQVLPHPMRFRRHRGRRPRMAAKNHRGKERPLLRLLPPGSFSDYLTMFHAKHPQFSNLSLKLFCSESRSDFK